MVLHFGERDSLNPPATLDRIRAGFAAAGSTVKINVYADVDHAFASPGRPSYNKAAAMMAYSRSHALFRKVLGPDYDLSTLWDDVERLLVSLPGRFGARMPTLRLRRSAAPDFAHAL